MVSDATGRSVVIESRNSVISIIPSDICTNFYLASDDMEDYYRNGVLREEAVKMTDEDGKVYVWKTTAHLMKETLLGNPKDEVCEVDTYFPQRGDVFIIRATVKGESEYKGETQTEINRVVVTEIVSKFVKQVEERAEKQKQTVDLEAGDQIVEMPYKAYKTHYADCEIVEGSYNDEWRTIKVIVRAGRMKPSGVRGEHFFGYDENIASKAYHRLSS